MESNHELFIYLSIRKKLWIGYILLLFFGFFGIHRFYTEYKQTAIFQLVFSIVGFCTVFIGIGLFFLAVNAIFLIVDLFLMPTMIDVYNCKLKRKLNLKEIDWLV